MCAAACVEASDHDAPGLLSSSIEDQAAGLDPSAGLQLHLVFDEPMATTTGHASLTTLKEHFDVPLAWAAGGEAVTLDLAGLLRVDRSYRLTLEEFEDLAGNSLEPEPAWRDGALRFATRREDFIRPATVETIPGQGQQGIYPAAIIEGLAPRVRITARFAEEMDPSANTVSWGPAGGARSAEKGTWSADGRSLVIDLVAPPFTGRRPLEDQTTYEVDLGGLRDLAGNAAVLAERSADTILRFSTGTYDALLNHSCGHVYFGPFAAVSATSAADTSAPRTDLAHTRFTVTLPAGANAHHGYARLRSTSVATWHLFLDGEIPITVLDGAGATLPSVLEPTPAACAGITHRLTFSLPELTQAFLAIGPQPSAAARFIVEQVTTAGVEGSESP